MQGRGWKKWRRGQRRPVRERRRVKEIRGRVPEVLKGERVLEDEGAVGRKWGEVGVIAMRIVLQ